MALMNNVVLLCPLYHEHINLQCNNAWTNYNIVVIPLDKSSANVTGEFHPACVRGALAANTKIIA